MIIRVFVDSDIVLDLLARRGPHYESAARLFTLFDAGKVKAFTSPLVFANIHYILRKLKSKEVAIQSLRKLKAMVNVLPIDEKIIDQSLNSDFRDFEDAIQYYTAINNGIKVILTRNASDYKSGDITVSDSEQFIRAWELQSSS